MKKYFSKCVRCNGVGLVIYQLDDYGKNIIHATCFDCKGTGKLK